jgi:hypothetical protein
MVVVVKENQSAQEHQLGYWRETLPRWRLQRFLVTSHWEAVKLLVLKWEMLENPISQKPTAYLLRSSNASRRWNIVETEVVLAKHGEGSYMKRTVRPDWQYQSCNVLCPGGLSLKDVGACEDLDTPMSHITVIMLRHSL